jgi:hypothetical protein
MATVNYGTPRIGQHIDCDVNVFKKITHLENIRCEQIFTLEKKDRKPTSNTYKLVIKPRLIFTDIDGTVLGNASLTGTFDVTFSSVTTDESPDDFNKLIECIQMMFNTTYEAFRIKMKGTKFENLNTVFIDRNTIIDRLKMIALELPNFKFPELN